MIFRFICFIFLLIGFQLEAAIPTAPPSFGTPPQMPTNIPSGGFPGLGGAGAPIKKPKPAKAPDLEALSPSSNISSIKQSITIDPTANSKKSQDNIFQKAKQGVANSLRKGAILPAIYYTYPFGPTLGISIYNKKEKDWNSTFFQLEGGANNVGFKFGIAELSPVGFGYSAGIILANYMIQDGYNSETLFEAGSVHLGAEVGVMFSLVIIRFGASNSYNKALQFNDYKTYLSFGVGIF